MASSDQINALAERLVNGVVAEHGTSATRRQLLDAMASDPEVEALTGREMGLLIEKVHDLAHSARLNTELS